MPVDKNGRWIPSDGWASDREKKRKQEQDTYQSDMAQMDQAYNNGLEQQKQQSMSDYLNSYDSNMEAKRQAEESISMLGALNQYKPVQNAPSPMPMPAATPAADPWNVPVSSVQPVDYSNQAYQPEPPQQSTGYGVVSDALKSVKDGFVKKSMDVAAPIVKGIAIADSIYNNLNKKIYSDPNLPDNPVTQVGRGFVTPNMENRTTAEKFGASSRAGMGDMFSTHGGAQNYFGNEEIGKPLQELGKANTEGFDIKTPDFTWKRLLEPDFYATTITRSIPTTLSLMPLNLMGGGMGGMAARGMGAGPFATHVLQAAGAGLTSAPVEAAMEANQTYEDMLKKPGMTEAEAKKAADKTFWGNAGLLALTNSLEFGTAFMPKGLSKGVAGKVLFNPASKLAGNMLQEGGEEAGQDVVSRWASGDPISWDAKMQEQFVVGALMGGVFGAAGILNDHKDTLQNRVLEKLDAETKAEYNDFVEQARSAGVPEEQAKQQALDMLAEHPTGQEHISQSVKEIQESIGLEAQATADTPKASPEFVKWFMDKAGPSAEELMAAEKNNKPQPDYTNYTGAEQEARRQTDPYGTLTGYQAADFQPSPELQTNPETGVQRPQGPREEFKAGDMVRIPGMAGLHQVAEDRSGKKQKVIGQDGQAQFLPPQAFQRSESLQAGDIVTVPDREGTFTVSDLRDGKRVRVTDANGTNFHYDASQLQPSFASGQTAVQAAAPQAQAPQTQSPETAPMTTGAYAHLPGAREEVAPMVKGTGVKLDYNIEKTKPTKNFPNGRERIIVSRGKRKYYYELGENGQKSDFIHPDQKANYRDAGGVQGLRQEDPNNLMPGMHGSDFLMHKDQFINYLEGRDYQANIEKRKYRDLPDNFTPTHGFPDGRKAQVEFTPDGRVAKWIADNGEFGSTAADGFYAAPLNQALPEAGGADINQVRDHLSQFSRNDYVSLEHDGETKVGRILNGGGTTHNVQLMLLGPDGKPRNGKYASKEDNLTLELADPSVMTLRKKDREAISQGGKGPVIDVDGRTIEADPMGGDYQGDSQDGIYTQEMHQAAEQAKANRVEWDKVAKEVSKEELTGRLNQLDEKQLKDIANEFKFSGHGAIKKKSDLVPFLTTHLRRIMDLEETPKGEKRKPVNEEKMLGNLSGAMNAEQFKIFKTMFDQYKNKESFKRIDRVAVVTPFADQGVFTIHFTDTKTWEEGFITLWHDKAGTDEESNWAKTELKTVAKFNWKGRELIGEPDYTGLTTFETTQKQRAQAARDELDKVKQQREQEKEATKEPTKEGNGQTVRASDNSFKPVTQHVTIEDGKVKVQSRAKNLDHELLPRGFDAKSLTGMSYSFNLDDYLKAAGSFGNPHSAIDRFIKQQFDYQGMLEKHGHSMVVDHIKDSQIRAIEKAIAQMGIETAKAADRKPKAPAQKPADPPMTSPAVHGFNIGDQVTDGGEVNGTIKDIVGMPESKGSKNIVPHAGVQTSSDFRYIPLSNLKPQSEAVQKEPKAPNVLNDHHARMKERAERARERIKQKYGSGGNTLNSGLPLDLITDLTIIGYSKFLDGVADFKVWADEMVKESPHGERTRKHLYGVFAQVQHIASLPDDEANTFIDELLVDAYGENPDADMVKEPTKNEPTPNTVGEPDREESYYGGHAAIRGNTVTVSEKGKSFSFDLSEWPGGKHTNGYLNKAQEDFMNRLASQHGMEISGAYRAVGKLLVKSENVEATKNEPTKEESKKPTKEGFNQETGGKQPHEYTLKEFMDDKGWEAVPVNTQDKEVKGQNYMRMPNGKNWLSGHVGKGNNEKAKKLFHADQVYYKVFGGYDVSAEVLKDYPELKKAYDIITGIENRIEYKGGDYAALEVNGEKHYFNLTDMYNDMRGDMRGYASRHDLVDKSLGTYKTPGSLGGHYLEPLEMTIIALGRRFPDRTRFSEGSNFMNPYVRNLKEGDKVTLHIPTDFSVDSKMGIFPKSREDVIGIVTSTMFGTPMIKTDDGEFVTVYGSQLANVENRDENAPDLVYGRMVTEFRVNSKWKAPSKIAHLTKMKEYAETHGLEFAEKYQKELDQLTEPAKLAIDKTTKELEQQAIDLRVPAWGTKKQIQQRIDKARLAREAIDGKTADDLRGLTMRELEEIMANADMLPTEGRQDRNKESHINRLLEWRDGKPAPTTKHESTLEFGESQVVSDIKLGKFATPADFRKAMEQSGLDEFFKNADHWDDSVLQPLWDRYFIKSGDTALTEDGEKVTVTKTTPDENSAIVEDETGKSFSTRLYDLQKLTEQPAAETPKAALDRISKNGVTINRNQEKGGVEIKFEKKPEADAIKALHDSKFRWSAKQKMWYAKFTPERWELLQRLQNQAKPLNPEQEKAIEQLKQQAQGGPALGYTPGRIFIDPAGKILIERSNDKTGAAMKYLWLSGLGELKEYGARYNQVDQSKMVMLGFVLDDQKPAETTDQPAVVETESISKPDRETPKPDDFIGKEIEVQMDYAHAADALPEEDDMKSFLNGKKGARNLVNRVLHKIGGKYAVSSYEDAAHMVEVVPTGESSTITTGGIGKEEAYSAPMFKSVGPLQVNSNSSLEQQLANKLKSMIHQEQEIKSGDLFKAADEVFKGTQGQGRYTPKDAYDALELAVNQYLLEQMEFNPPLIDLKAKNIGTVMENVEKLAALTKRLPTQTKRTEEQEQFQQFSTPPAIAYVASWVANINANDTVLEPSAGIGGLAVFGKANGAQVVVNELDPRRLEIIKQMPFDRFFKEDGEQINNILPKDVKPTVVIMNPPFSTSAGRGVTDTKNSFNHVEQALKRLQPGGRLVAILGLSRDGKRTKGFIDWMKKLQETYNVRAVVGIDGKNYTKYGTSFDVQYLVIDKTGATINPPLMEENSVASLDQAIRKLEGIANDKQGTAATNQQSESASDQSSGTPNSSANPGGRTGSSDTGSSSSSGTADGLGNRKNSGKVGNKRGTSGTADSSGGQAQPGAADGGTDAVGGWEPDVRNPSLESEDGSGDDSGSVGEQENQPGDHQPKVKKQLTDSVFEEYVPRKLKIRNAKKHPGELAESAAMSAIDPPDVTYKPAIPENVIKQGLLSDVQLEAITYAGQAHEQMLPDGKQRKGFFIGDGTGVGKGREISGIILDNFMQGRTKAVWVTMNDGLLPSARRDWADLGGTEKDIFEAPKMGSDIKPSTGILFTKYGTIGSGLSVGSDGRLKVDEKKQSRLDQIVNWLGADFDGVIAFDEAHNMSNAIAQKGNRGTKKASAQALAGVELQKRLPNARIVYVSATGATEVSNFAYAERLGLWGPGTAFANKADFISKISEGGIAAMELVARDMKAMGMYIARNLSYNGVQYDKLEHKLTSAQRGTYETLASSWQIVLQNINEALKVIGVVEEDSGKTLDGRAKGRVVGQFWGAQQRFFNQVITSMQMPTVIEQVKKDLAEGKAVVMQLVNTNEATQERGITKIEEEEGSLDDIDLTPRDIILQFLDNSFPVFQYEKYIDEDGNERSRMVTDSEGNPVINAEAQAMKDALMEKLSTLRVPEGPIEMVLNEFGVGNVAEITGRSRRIVEKQNEETGRMERVLENRGSQAGEADATAFMAGDKQILIFSNAGGTGRSYHADLTKKNQKQRVHYLIQPGWEATKAVQGFGRTHRTNQASAPIYKLITTDLKGQMRFVSSIARRLDQLGALTKGQRQTGSQGFFKASDNLEGRIATDALALFYSNLATNRIPSLNRDDILTKMGLRDKLLDEYNRFNSEAPEVREITKFLNRILVLEPDLQNQVFEEFQRTLEDLTEVAIQNGMVDNGLENLKSDTANVVEEVEIRKDEATNSTTKYYQIEVGYKAVPVELASLTKNEGFIGVYQNEGSKAVRAMFERGSKTLANGQIVGRYTLQGQEKFDYKNIDGAELEKSRWIKIEDQEEAAQLWKSELAKLPEYRTDNVHMISGTLLPVWDRLPNTKTRVVRVSLDNGDILLGRIIPNAAINNTLHKLGAERRSQKVDMDSLPDKILNDDHTVTFANGWKLVRRRISGEQRIELIGDDLYKHSQNLRDAGVFAERIAYTTRYFIPTGEKGAATIKNIARTTPISEVTPPSSAGGAVQTFLPQRNQQPVNNANKASSKQFMSKTSGGPVTRTQILTFISKEFRVPIGSGRYKGRARAIYNTFTNEMRTKTFGDFVAIAHELGHRLDNNHKFSDNPNQAIKMELENMAQTLVIPKRFTQKQIRAEGVAEFMRLFLSDPQQAQTDAPNFFNQFTQALDADGKIDAAYHLQSMMERWYGQSASERVRGVTDMKGGSKLPKTVTEFKAKLENAGDKAYDMIYEELAGMDRALDAMLGNDGKENLAGNKNPFLLAQKTRGSAGRVKAFLEYGVTDDQGNKIGNSLKAILGSVPDLATFRDYIESLRSRELHEQGKYKTPISVDDANTIIDDVESGPDFKAYLDAFADLSAFQDAVTDELVRSGMLSSDTVEQWKDEHFFYVPFYRVMEEAGERGDKKGGHTDKKFANLQDPIKGMKKAGSGKNIIDPLESIIKNTYLFVSLAERNKVGVAWADLSDSTEDSAHIMVKVANPTMVKAFSLEQIADDLEAAGFDLSDPSIDLQAVAKIFTQTFTPSAANRVLNVWRNGKIQQYQIRNEDLYGAFLNLDPEPMKAWVKMLSIPNHILRAGITLAPSFIPKNPMRSVFSMLMQSDSFTTPKDFMQFMPMVAKNLWGTMFKGDDYWKWASTGGAQSTLASIENEYLKDSSDLILRGTWKEKLVRGMKSGGLKPALNVLRKLSELGDEPLRMAEAQMALKKTGDITTAATRSRDIDVDFSRFGTNTRTINAINLFFNVALQGPEKVVRTLKEHPVRTMIRGSLFIMLPTMLLMALNWDDDDYWELPQWRRDLFWNIPIGGGDFFSWPMPFEWGLLFKIIPERIATEYRNHVGASKQMKSYAQTAVGVLAPSVVPTYLIGGIQWAANAKIANLTEQLMFGESAKPIVPQRLQDEKPEKQVKPGTSETAKMIGRTFGTSPVKVDQLITDTTSTLGRGAVSATDWALRATGAADTAPKPANDKGMFARTFITSARDSSGDSMDAFYKKLDNTELSYKEKQQKGLRVVPLELQQLRKNSELLAAMRSISDTVYASKKLTPKQKETLLDRMNAGMTDIARKSTGKTPLNLANMNKAMGNAIVYKQMRDRRIDPTRIVESMGKK